MKKIIMFFSVFLILSGLNAQTLSTDTFSEGNGNLPDVGTNFDVPIDVTGIGTINTLTVYLEYDNTVMSYTGFANNVANTTVSNITPTVLKVLVADFPNPITIADGKLIDLQFDYLGGYSDLTFHTWEYGAYKSSILEADYTTTYFYDVDVTNGAVEGYWNDTISGGDWNTATNWSLGVVPTVWHNATVAAGTETTITAAAVAHNVEIETGGQLTLSSTLDVDGNFFIESSATGSGSFINNGTLTVTGTSSAQCYVTNGQWHGIASPVSGEDFSAMYLGGNPEVWVKEYDETTNSYSEMYDTTTAMGDMQGWFTWVQTSSVPQTFTFTGAYRTGTIGSAGNMAHANSGHNYVGNPFTSAIDWDAAAGWTKTNMKNAIYVYNNGNWASYVGGVGAAGGSRYIAMSQGFFVQVSGAGTGTLQMDVDVCVHNSVAYLKSQDTELQVVRLQIEDAGMVDEAVIVFRDGATEGLDDEFDAGKFFSFNADYPQIYSTANNYMSINALPFTAQESVALDVRGKDGNSLTISATETAGFENLSLKDEFTGDFVNLNEKSYTFLYDAEVTDRFTLFFSPTGIGDNPLSENAVKIFAYDNNIQVVLSELDHANISVYNLLGQEVATVSTNTNITRISVDKSGYYLVKVSDGKHYSTQKVFIK
ncbi:MAG: T9SS type A sorting domain-containing protein [Bacteroidales bacterium]|nr:T9SS type A sorting domain-containing protein [Bacteroidales bacterium]MCF6341182.1 T9SS type A sorting domain-containing protein [Bacteroidales bacterium]